MNGPPTAVGRSGAGQRRKALMLLEAMVMIAIVGALLGLLLPAIIKVRAASLQVQCSNQQRQVILAAHQYANNYGGRLPRLDGNSITELHSFFFSILPYIEHGSYYAEVQIGRREGSSHYTMKPYLCPADPTVDWQNGGAQASYAANAQVFLRDPHLAHGFRDGASATIVLAEHYAFPMHGKTPEQTQFDWFHYLEPMKFPPNHTLRRASFADFVPGVTPRPVDVARDDVYPVTTGDPPLSLGSLPGLSFQVRPRIDDCDPRIPQTPHSSGMVTGMADGSVRILHRGMDAGVFWALVTPTSGEIVGVDW